MTKPPHDRLVKAVFSEARQTVLLLDTFLPPGIRQRIRFERENLSVQRNVQVVSHRSRRDERARDPRIRARARTGVADVDRARVS